MAQPLGGKSGAGVGVRVDEARRDVQPRRVDHLVCPDVAEVADRVDPVAPDQHVRVDPRVPGAVHHSPVSDQNGPVLSGYARGEGQPEHTEERQYVSSHLRSPGTG